jgi:hypothetical protein
MPREFLTPVGRLVQGSATKGRTTDFAGKPLTDAKNQPRTEYFIAVAIPKTDPGVAALLETIRAEAREGFPSLFRADPNGPPTFAWKITDGDSRVPNRSGVIPADHEGFPGNWIFKFSSGFPFSCFSKGAASQLTEPDAIKCGYYVRVAGNVAANANAQYPGVYLNARGIELVGYGPEIQSQGDAGAAFREAPAAALPPGASPVPIAGTPPAGMMPGGAPATPQAGPWGGAAGGAPVTPQAGPWGGAAGDAPVTPQAGPWGAPPAAPPAAPATPQAAPPMAPPSYLHPPAPPLPAAPARIATINGVDYTVDQLRGFGWTQEQIDAAVVPF